MLCCITILKFGSGPDLGRQEGSLDTVGVVDRWLFHWEVLDECGWYSRRIEVLYIWIFA